MTRIVAVPVLAFFGLAIVLHASDRTGIYAVIDKVVFEPDAKSPVRIQIWGAFAVASQDDPSSYQPVQSGYLYLAVDESNEVARREWNDLEQLANSHTVVAFGRRAGQSVRVRHDEEMPGHPDRYVTGIGVQMIRADGSYAPVQAVAAHIRR